MQKAARIASPRNSDALKVRGPPGRREGRGEVEGQGKRLVWLRPERIMRRSEGLTTVERRRREGGPREREAKVVDGRVLVHASQTGGHSVAGMRGAAAARTAVRSITFFFSSFVT